MALAALACSKGTEQAGPDAAGPLAAPERLTIKGVTETSVTMQWDAVDGAQSYDCFVSSAAGDGRVTSSTRRNVTLDGLTAGTAYVFNVRAVAGERVSAWSKKEFTTEGTVPQDPQDQPTPPGPDQELQCVDAPILLGFDKAPVLGTSGLIQVFTADGTLVDKIDMKDYERVTLLSDGTMVPAGADADKGVIAITNDSPFHTFMDALHSTQYRLVHYTPLRIKGNKLEIKLHNGVLDFGKSYYLTMDASVCGEAVERADFTTKAKPAGTTLTVKPDDSADFCTVQGALSYASTLGKDTAVTIEIGEGTYPELLFLRNKDNVTLKGASRTGTVIAYPNNDSYETGSGASVASVPALGAALGKSGGRCLFLVENCDNLVLENLTIENTYSIPSHKGQAETLYFNDGSNARKLTIENCSLISWQDTFLTKGLVWVHNSLIAGHVDYIWGYPKACLFEDCEIRSRAGGYIVQARINAAADKGFVFLNCKLTAADGVADGSMYLARSGGDATKYDNVTYVNCQMSPVIAPAGWFTKPAPNPSAPTATAGWKEYGTTGVSTASRNACGRILTEAEAEPYSSRAAVLGW